MPAVLDDVRVLELTGLIGQQCGKLFAGMGADVIKIEPPGGAEGRSVGPFLDDTPHPDRCLAFWHYNASKRSVTLDIRSPAGADVFRRLARTADVLIEDHSPGYLPGLGLGYSDLKAQDSKLIYVSITPFGQTGPYRDYRSSDLVSLALGGPLWSCGYDDHGLPPARPYTDAAHHIGSHYAFIGATAALVQRQLTGEGQYIDVSIHEACHDTTEGAMPTYYFGNQRVQRQTGRHAASTATQPVLFPCSDGKWVFTRVPVEDEGWEKFLEWLDEAGMVVDLRDERYNDYDRRMKEMPHITEVLAAFCATQPSEELYHGAQRRGMVWAAVRSPDETVHDEHLLARSFFLNVDHPELGRSFQYAGAPYRFSETPWAVRHRAPLLGEHNEEVYCGELGLSPAELAALKEARLV